MSIPVLKAVIFDLDGTLAETKLDFALMCKELDLPEGTPLLEYCAEIGDIERVKQVFEVIERHEMQGANSAIWIEGAQLMLNQLHQANIPLAIVTRNMRKAAQATIDKLDIPIDFLITREDCQPKPHPEGLLKVAAKWQLNVANIAYVGDYKYDLLAARNAGMSAILIATDSNRHFSAMADIVIETFEQLSALVLNNNFEFS